MTTGQTIAGVLLFAAVTAVLYVWGLKKSLGQQEDLTRALLSVCGSRVLKYLKKHDLKQKEFILGLIQQALADDRDAEETPEVGE